MKLPDDDTEMLTGLRRSFRSDFARKLCEKTAGPYFEEMLQDFDVTKVYLKHIDPRARLGALLIIREYWKPPPNFPQICEIIAFEDDDLQVRCGALSSLCGCYYGTHDVRMGRLFAEVVGDQLQPLLFRRIAYFALYSIKGLGDQLPDTQTFQFPESVNWDFVGGFFEKKNGEG